MNNVTELQLQLDATIATHTQTIETQQRAANSLIPKDIIFQAKQIVINHRSQLQGEYYLMAKPNQKKNDEDSQTQGDGSSLQSYDTGPMIGPNGITPPPVSITLGNKADILAMIKALGWSEEALAAFKSGKTITHNVTQTPFGNVGTDEDWIGKKESDDKEEGKK